MKNIKGNTALITGGSRGLGPHIARFLAKEGVNVALTARTKSALDESIDSLASFNVKAKAFPADLTDSASRAKLLENVKNHFGPIDILINNAGMEWVCAYSDMSPEQIETMIQTNMIAPMLLARMVIPQMVKQKKGHIVTMSSLGGKKGSPYSATYAGTKAGLIQWTSGIRQELKGTGVSASVICPGFVSESGMFAVYGKKAPKITGETTPEKVALAVIRAIKKDIQEIIVNPGLIWPMIWLDAIDPRIMCWVLRKFGVYEFYRKQAQENQDQEKRL